MTRWRSRPRRSRPSMPDARWPRSALAACAVAALLAPAGPAGSEIYRWTDRDGRVHFTQDLNQVPPEHRSAAEEAAKAPPGRSRVQTIRGPMTTRPRSVGGPAAPSPGAPQTWRVRVERAGNSLRVGVRLNDRVVAPFIIDTGASHVIVPRAVVDQLGLDLDGARTAQYSTANGTITSKLVVLDSVSLGGARVDHVPAAVSDSLPVGLLGLSYFNRFQYQIDPASGIVTLTRNGLEESGHIRGGRSEADWRSQYRQLRDRMEQVEVRRRRIPESHSRTHEALDAESEALERELRLLESEADDARVPFAWRE